MCLPEAAQPSAALPQCSNFVLQHELITPVNYPGHAILSRLGSSLPTPNLLKG